MFQSKIFAAGKWANGTHDEERREGGLMYVKMASIQEEIEEEARTPPSPPPTHKTAETWCTRRKLGRFDDARRTKDLLEAEAHLYDDHQQKANPGDDRATCDLGSADLVLRASGSRPQPDDAGGRGQPGSGRNFALFLQNMEERACYGWTDSQVTGTFPPYYLERQDSGLSIISTISEDTDELDEYLDDEEEDDNEVLRKTEKQREDDAGSKSIEEKYELRKESSTEERTDREMSEPKKSKKKLRFWDGPDPNVVSVD
jgi:hypothetical protein